MLDQHLPIEHFDKAIDIRLRGIAGHGTVVDDDPDIEGVGVVARLFGSLGA
ncbi:MAG: hypothetical protein AAGA21_04015 [Pseudomonadota bacterium]